MLKKFPLCLALLVFVSDISIACESCILSRMGKEGAVRSESSDRKWFFEYLFEQKNYDRMDAREAHNLHHAGYEVHNKTTEDLHHMTLGANFSEDLKVFIEAPYVIRRFIEVDNHAILGRKQRSEGWGDMSLVGSYRFWKDEWQSLSAVGGVKFPTGYTKEIDTVGNRFEPEFQLGSGSMDYIVGGIYRMDLGRADVVANMSYVMKTEGAHDFRHGNAFTGSMAGHYLLNPGWKDYRLRSGVDFVYQQESTEQHNGERVADSGGRRLLAGPTMHLAVIDGAGLSSSILFPVYQNQGGFHQELDYTWTLGCKLQW